MWDTLPLYGALAHCMEYPKDGIYTHLRCLIVYQGLLRSKTTLALRLFTTRALMLFLVVTPLKSSIHPDPLSCQELGCVTFATSVGLDTPCSGV